ncbi:MAG: agmatine deiminase family protein [Acidimicrobiia bacterium]
MHDEPMDDAEAVPLGLRWPAEWEPHERTLMAWPARPDLWGEFLDWARRDVAEIANTIAQFEPVTMVARPGSGEDASRRLGGRVEVVELPIDDSWLRDNGPVIMRHDDGTRVGVHFRFNGWGNKYHPYMADAAVAELLLDRLSIPRMLAPFVLENGSLSGDGEGTVVTTAQCNLNPNRNDEVTAAAVEARLKQWMGSERVLWLPRGLVEDLDTDGHVDNIAAFAPLKTVVVQSVLNERNPNFGALQENKKLLEKFGYHTLAVDHLPYSELGGKVSPVPYLNYYVCNGAVIVPVTGFDKGADAAALETIGEAYPGRQVVGVPGAVLAYGGGGVHCITQQVPTSDGLAPAAAANRSEASLPGELRTSEVITVRSGGVLPSLAAVNPTSDRRLLRVGVVQHAHDPDVAALRTQLAEYVEHAANEGADLICLPELFMDPYIAIDPDSWSQMVPGEVFPNGPSHEFLVDLARHTRRVIAGTIHTAAAQGGLGYNMSVIVDASGDTIWATPKLHLPVTAGYYEDQWFRAGEALADPVEVCGAKIAQPVCWDEWFPELARAYRLRGAEVLLYPSAIGSEPDFPDFDTEPMWQHTIVAHAIANGVHVIASNRVGSETRAGTTVSFYGSSFIADPYGRILAKAPRDRPCVLIADLDLDAGKDWLALFPFLKTRRPELYGELATAEETD